MKTKFYIAAPAPNQKQAVEFAENLLRMLGEGFACTSRWLYASEVGYDNTGETEEELTNRLRDAAIMDLADVRKADFLICCTTFGGRSSGGMHVESGYAFALGKPVVVYGHRECFLHWHPNVLVAYTIREVAAWIIGFKACRS